jgi:hypothetical protein
MIKLPAVGLVVAVLFAMAWCWVWGANMGFRRGACVEMCRPAQFDSDQKVNGGCLCVGSDKVLRIRPAP